MLAKPEAQGAGYAKAVGQTAGSVPQRCSTNAQKPQKPHQEAKNYVGDTSMITR